MKWWTQYQWLGTKWFLDSIALGQVTPGPILITATFVGYKVASLLSAFMATMGVFYLSFFILILLVPYHDRLRGVEKVRMMKQGVLASFIGMLALVLYNLSQLIPIPLPIRYKRYFSQPYFLIDISKYMA